MKKIFLFLILIFLPAIARAELWVCYDASTKEVTQTLSGDCLKLGLCSQYNNEGVRSGCFEATKEEFEKAQDQFVIYDPQVVSGSRIVDMSNEKKNEVIAEENATASQAATVRKNIIDSIKQKTGLTDEEVDFLLNN